MHRLVSTNYPVMFTLKLSLGVFHGCHHKAHQSASCSPAGPHLTLSTTTQSWIVCFLLLFRQRKDHHHHNPSYHSQSGARPHDSHSRGGAKAERQPSYPHHRRQRHDSDSSDGGSPVPRHPAGHKTAPAGAIQSHRRRHDTDSDD